MNGANQQLLDAETKTAAVVEKAIQQEPLTSEELAEVAPILPPETVKEQAKASGKKYNIAALSEIAPFLDDSVLEEMVEKMEVENLTLLTCIAPFLSERALDKLVRRAPADDLDGKMMETLVPFLSDGALDRLVEESIATGKTGGLFRLYPFLSQTTLKKLTNHLMEAGNPEEIQKAAVFL